jgi:transposase-like protein
MAGEVRHAPILAAAPESESVAVQFSHGLKLAAIVAALEGGTSKAAVCRAFGIKRSTLIDSLARIGWSPGFKDSGGMSDATAAADPSPDPSTVQSTYGSA